MAEGEYRRFLQGASIDQITKLVIGAPIKFIILANGELRRYQRKQH